MASSVLSGSGPAAIVFVALAAVMGVATATAYYEQLGPYYQHDVVSRPNFTTLINVRGYTRTEGFGAISVFDDPITVTPDINSETVGRVQGTSIVTSLDVTSALTTQTLHLPGGTLNFIGEFAFIANPGSSSKLHCVGGTGEYQSVHRGIYELEVFSFDEVALNAVMKITVYYHKS